MTFRFTSVLLVISWHKSNEKYLEATTLRISSVCVKIRSLNTLGRFKNAGFGE